MIFHFSFSKLCSSFVTLFPFVKPGGLYFFEDLSTSYWPWWKDHGVTYLHPNSTIEFIKHLIDGLNRDVDIGEDNGFVGVIYDISYYIQAIYCYAEICVFERNDNQKSPQKKSQEYFANIFVEADQGRAWRRILYNRAKSLKKKSLKGSNSEEVERYQQIINKYERELSDIGTYCVFRY